MLRDREGFAVEQILSLCFPIFKAVTSGKLHGLSEPQFAHLEGGHNDSSFRVTASGPASGTKHNTFKNTGGSGSWSGFHSTLRPLLSSPKERS